MTVNAKVPDAAAQVVKQTGGGTKGVLVKSVSPPAFAQAIHVVRRKSTVILVGLPPGEFAMPINEVVLGRITQELAGAIEFAAEGKIHPHIHKMQLEGINDVFTRMKSGTIDDRMVMTF